MSYRNRSALFQRHGFRAGSLIFNLLFSIWLKCFLFLNQNAQCYSLKVSQGPSQLPKLSFWARFDYFLCDGKIIYSGFYTFFNHCIVNFSVNKVHFQVNRRISHKGSTYLFCWWNSNRVLQDYWCREMLRTTLLVLLQTRKSMFQTKSTLYGFGDYFLWLFALLHTSFCFFYVLRAIPKKIHLFRAALFCQIHPGNDLQMFRFTICSNRTDFSSFFTILFLFFTKSRPFQLLVFYHFLYLFLEFVVLNPFRFIL